MSQTTPEKFRALAEAMSNFFKRILDGISQQGGIGHDMIGKICQGLVTAAEECEETTLNALREKFLKKCKSLLGPTEGTRICDTLWEKYQSYMKQRHQLQQQARAQQQQQAQQVQEQAQQQMQPHQHHNQMQIQQHPHQQYQQYQSHNAPHPNAPSQQPFQSSMGALHNQVPVQYQQQAYPPQFQQSQQQSFAGTMPVQHQQQSFSGQHASSNVNMYGHMYGQQGSNNQSYNSSSYNMMSGVGQTGQMMHVGGQPNHSMGYPANPGMYSSQLAQAPLQNLQNATGQQQYVPPQQVAAANTSAGLDSSVVVNAPPVAGTSKPSKPRQPRKSKSAAKDSARATDGTNDAVTPAPVGDAVIAQDNSGQSFEAVATNIAEDDDGTEKPLLNEKTFNLTDGRVVQADEVDQDALLDEEDKARAMARRALGDKTPVVEQVLDLSEPTRLNIVNILDVERLMQRVNATLGSQLKIDDNAKRLFSNAIQQHLCTVLESAIVGARSRYQVSASRHFNALSEHFEAGNGVTNNQLSEFGFRWGPDTKVYLDREEIKADYLVKKFNEKDKMNLIKEMKEFLSKPTLSGNKRRVDENLDKTWKIYEESAAREGKLSFDQISSFHFKSLVFQPYVRDVSSLKEAPVDANSSEIMLQPVAEKQLPLKLLGHGQAIDVTVRDLQKVLNDSTHVSSKSIIRYK